MTRSSLVTLIGLAELVLAAVGLAVFLGVLLDIAFVRETLGDVVAFMLPDLTAAAEAAAGAGADAALSAGGASAEGAAAIDADPDGAAAVQALLERPVGDSAGDAWYLYARIGLSAVSILGALLILARIRLGRMIAVLSWAGIAAVCFIAPGFGMVAKVIPVAVAVVYLMVLYLGPGRGHFARG